MNGRERRYGAGRARIAVGLAVALWAISGNANAGQRAGTDWCQVHVSLTSQVELPRVLLQDGEDAASIIFSGIHVELLWARQEQEMSKAVARCLGELNTPNLAVEIVPHAPASVSDVALAMAMPCAKSGVRVMIFYDRVDPLLGGHHAPEAKILGYVLAHEIAHVLQGIARHSESGIMRARWTDNDFKQMGMGTLTFTNEDVQLIRRHLHLDASTPLQAEHIVTVFVQDGAIVPGLTLIRAKGLAAEMFTKAGVRIDWRIGRPSGEAIAVSISNVTSNDYHPGAFAFALPYEGVHITVFYDRISKAVAPNLAPALLAHVLVHEITHTLQGIDRHSDTGVMKAQWATADYLEMRVKPLPFTDRDVQLIQEGLESRAARLSARGGVPKIPCHDDLQ